MTIKKRKKRKKNPSNKHIVVFDLLGGGGDLCKINWLFWIVIMNF